MLAIAVLLALTVFLAYKSLRFYGIALVGLNCMFAVEQWAQSQSIFFAQRGTLINLTFAAVAIIALTAKFYRGKISSDPYPLVGYLAVALFSFALLSTFWTSDVVEVDIMWRRAAPYVVLQILIAPLLVSGPKELERIFNYQILIGGLFLGLLLIGADYEGRKVIIEGGESSGGNPLAIAQLGGVTLICAVMGRRLFRWDTVFRLAIAGICLISIVKSGSRGQLVGLVAALAISYPFAYSIKNPKIFVGTACAALVFVYVVASGLDSYWADSVRWSSEGMSDDYGGRIEKALKLLNVWVNDPGAILIGLGNSASADPAINGSYPHMVPVEILGEEGLIGAILYLWILILTLRDSKYALRRKDRVSDDRTPFAILVGIISYLLIISLKQGNLLGTSQMFMNVILLGKLAMVTRKFDRVASSGVKSDKVVKSSPARRTFSA